MLGRIILYSLFAFLSSGEVNGKGTLLSGSSPDATLRVDASGRYLEYTHGSPFLYLGDTAWELFARLDEKEAIRYLDDRKSKGFTVIQAVILSELDGTDQPTKAGMTQLIDNDVTRPHPAYLKHIDRIIQAAAERNLLIGLLPTWGDKVDKQWGNGPELFNVENARIYGKLLGERYAGYSNIIWIIGGDRGGAGKNKAIWNAMAGGIKEKDKNHLMTFHPQGEHSSSFWFHDEEWMDFNMFQSGHCQSTYAIYRRLLWPDYDRKPTKPVLDAEPRYEDIPVNFKEEDGRFTAYDIRKTLYQTMLSGACGYTYGCNNIWQMYAPGREPKCNARNWWYESLNMEGCNQLVHFNELWKAFDFRKGVPLREAVLPTDGYNEDEAVAFGNDTYHLFYFPGGENWKIKLGDAWNKTYQMHWMNPRNGTLIDAGEGNKAVCEITLPEKGEENDWVLIFRKKDI